MQLKTTTLNRIKDNAEFQLSKRSTAAIYRRDYKEKGEIVFTSLKSKRSFKQPGITVVYIKK